ncbi:phosphopantetheine-binding protein [Streptomyces rubellomurinus]|uniref:Carrier domain-containing protein n=2 Tax=Streptomyces TaxID=1883 RepID=A0A0F2T4Z8_STRR3|nr:phosphopantetheine-binding protein [Streptomyces rubellomurinus]KJS54255.1 hypothetical protein VM98_20160 [Streptomyces rubellomurinus subsp. indigoferus]KJS58299.1 hypothetical protein VM95_34190 [Streptomyces rubellomurinus]
MTATPEATPLLGTVRDAWASVLGHQDFGDDENFNRVGGHSGAALRISKILRTALGRPVPIKLLFAHPTVRGQAEALAASDTDTATAAVPVGARA